MKKVLVYKDFVLKVEFMENNTQIMDSYRIKSIKEMRNVLSFLRREADENMAIHKRSISGMIREWRVHNMLYSLGLFKDRTKDVDLNMGVPWYMRFLYALLSPFYLHY